MSLTYEAKNYFLRSAWSGGPQMALRIRVSKGLMSFWPMATISEAWRLVAFTMVATTLHRVALEQGMHTGTHRALSGMYTQLTRCFEIIGCLCSFFAATNGILQGCPLSVILINLMTSVWKKILDAQSQAMRVSSARLPLGGTLGRRWTSFSQPWAMPMTHTAWPRDNTHSSPCWNVHTSGYRPQGKMSTQRNHPRQ